MDEADRRREPFAISAISLLEAALLSGRRTRDEVSFDDFDDKLSSDLTIQIMPLTLEIAIEVEAVGDGLRDPADRAIVATARVHRLKLITSDQRIIDSGLVPVIV